MYIYTTLTMFTVVQPSSNIIAKDLRHITPTEMPEMSEYKQYSPHPWVVPVNGYMEINT